MTQPTLTFFLDQRHQLKDGSFPVKLTVYYAGNKKRYRTPFTATVVDFAKITAERLRDEPTKKLKKAMFAWLKIQSDAAEQIEPFSFFEFDAFFFKEEKEMAVKHQPKSIEGLFTKYIQQLKKEERISTADSYNNALTSLLSFKKNLQLEHITVDFLNAYEKWMIANDRSTATVGFYLRALRAIFNEAIEAGLIDSSKYPFKKYTIPAPKRTNRTLKKEELKKVLNYKTDNQRIQRALDYWTFSFICNGINFKDIALLRNSDIKGEFIEFIRAKTKNTNQANALPIRIPLNDRNKAILEKLRQPNKDAKSYIFPILKTGISAEQVEKSIETFIRNTNKALEKVEEELKLSIRLSTYVARHSFASTQKNNNAPLIYIKEALGHANLKTTEGYLSSFEDDSLKSMHDNLLTGLFD